MKYILESKFKLLEPFEKELPNFVILTGINGVGKTQILQALNQNNNGLAKIFIAGLNVPVHQIRYIDKLLIPNDIHAIDRHSYNDSYDMELHNQLFPTYSNLLNYQSQYKQLPVTLENFQEYINQIYGYLSINSIQFKKIKSFIEENPNNRPNELDFFRDNFQRSYHPEIHDIFIQNFSTIFKNYQNLEFKNLFNEFLNKYKDKNIKYLVDEEFRKTHGNPPWENINSILETAMMDYEFEVPVDYDPNVIYEPKFIKKNSKNAVKISDLSSGEKILISLAFALYNKEHESQLPKVLLLDETDASLHPSMAKQYLNILKNVFVSELGIKVIITTHSPSTVALADEKDIFVVEKTNQPIRKCSKDEALSVLTAGVPSFSVNYENRKQIFVESHYDAEFYNEIYTLVKSQLESEISLSFISCGVVQKDRNYDPITGCAQVRNITDLMRNSGNKSCFGLIDWDKCNKEGNGIYVNAFNEQYSIENCLLNPLFIALLLTLKEIHPFENFCISLRTFDPNSQSTIDQLVNQLLDLINFNDSDVLDISLANGKITKIPRTYLHYQGHDLEDQILSKVPALKSLRKGNEPAKRIKLAIIQTVFRNYPELIPRSFINVFRKIQNSR